MNNDLSPQTSVTSSGMHNITTQFTDSETIHYSTFHIIVRAKRYGRWWVIKALREELRTDEAHIALLHKEFVSLISIQHPNIVYAVSFENVKEMGWGIVMEWIDGQTLQAWMSEKHTRKERLHILRQVLSALEYIHGQQTLQHSPDLSDVMITHNGQYVKLIGFRTSDSNSHNLVSLIEAMNLGRTYTRAAQKSKEPDNIKEVRRVFHYYRLLRRGAAIFLVILIFLSCWLAMRNKITTDRQAIATIELRLDSTGNKLKNTIEYEQALNDFMEEGMRQMEDALQYDLDTVTTFKACQAAIHKLYQEYETFLEQYYTAHPTPPSYRYTRAKRQIAGHWGEVTQPLYDKLFKLRDEEGYDYLGRKKR